MGAAFAPYKAHPYLILQKQNTSSHTNHMSDIIHLLPDSVANQIAAGEVIQRPASIVKELLENSLDAGATSIELIVTDAGKTSLQVIDNGKGMSETDARLSFERHATSKIHSATDLFALRTMGFRGEALASIAAVAQVELRTRQRGDEIGTKIAIEGSRLISQEPDLCDEGTIFTVNNIFFNIPARRKFLKSNQTEMANIMAEFERIALAHPEVDFKISSPSGLLLMLPAGNFRQRIVGIFGKRIDKNLLNVHVETPVVRISGYTGIPESSKKKGAQQFFFVNGRYMRHPYFAKAIQTAYERLIPEGEMVPFFLQLEVDPSKIDVNIHPTKTEIKFEDDQIIWQIMLAAIREALGKYSAIPTIDFDTAGCPDIPMFDSKTDNVRPPQIKINPGFNPFTSTGASRASFSDSQGRSGNSIPDDQHAAPPTFQSGSNYATDIPPIPEFTGSQPQTEPTSTTVLPADSSPLYGNVQQEQSATLYAEKAIEEQHSWDIATASFIQYRGRYLLCPIEEGLLIIDAPRAHLRILYDDMMKRCAESTIASQRLLFPELVDFSPAETLLLQNMMEELSHLGFDLSPLGGGTFSILAVPDGLGGLNPVRLLQEMVSDAASHPADAKEETAQILALTLSRKMAIPVGQWLSLEEMRDLAVQLFSSSNPNYTPDGHNITSIIAHQTLTARLT